MRRLLQLAAGAALCAHAAMADAELRVYPERVQLDNAEDRQRLVAVRTREDGITEDVTAAAQIGFAAEGIAAWDGNVVTPESDGDTEAVVAHEGAELRIPVTVRNSGHTPPVSFRNDVLPVMMRSNCNNGGCHGTARGQNGFHLSLFGYDPAADYYSLTREFRGRRMDPAAPAASLILTKPTGEVAHEGGTVLAPGDGMYETLLRWIEEGAPDDDLDALPSLTGISLLPEQAVLAADTALQRFTVEARYSNGETRDVTPLAVLSASDETVLTIDGAGQAQAGGQGETYVMARYGTFAVVSQVIVVPEDLEFAWPEDARPRNYIDEEVFAKLRNLRVPPAKPCGDSVFVRRVHLDILGILPTIAETQAFLADESPDKRAELIDALLERPEFSDVWAMKWAEALRVSTAGRRLDPKGLHRYNDWLRGAVTENKPLDGLVRSLLTAEGGNFANPASNFYLVETDPIQMAENVAQVFMGVQISCAQCHNHPFDQWTMDDYYSFAAFFAQVGRKQSSDPRETIVFNRGGGEVKHMVDDRDMPPKFLGGAQPDPGGADRRAVLADWLVSPENPWFARNIANRVWEHFFGRGIVDPVDDVRVTNPPSHPLLLETLGARLAESGYDLRQLIRDICNSYTYQMSTQARVPGLRDERNFAHASLRRMPAEQLLDAVCHVTGAQIKFPNLPLGARAVQVADGNSGNYFLDVFGRPVRETACACERQNEPTLAQTLHLINGETLQQAIQTPGGRLEQLIEGETAPAAAVQELYLAALARLPGAEELEEIETYMAASGNGREALEDVFWTVLNSKEFIFIR